MATVIRLAEPSDGLQLADIYRPAVTDSAVSFELEPPSGAEMGERVARVLQRTPWLVCARGDRLLGFAYATAHRERAAYQWSVDVSAYVHSDARRVGIARSLYSSLFAVLVVQGYRNAYAGISLPNVASVRLHESVGFTPVGVYRGVGFKHGAWRDVAWFERLLALREIAPGPPRLVPQCREEPEFMAAIKAGEVQFEPPVV